MKQLLLFCFTIFLLEGCSSSGSDSASKDSTQVTTAAEPEKKSQPAINYPYTASYSSDFKMGDPNHSKMVLELYKLFDAGKIAEMRPSFADTVDFTFSDGSHFRNSRDSLIAMVTGLRGSFKAISNHIYSWMPIHSNDKDADWVFIWAKEIRTSKKGVVDSSNLHEGWHIVNEKIDRAFQYEEKIKAK